VSNNVTFQPISANSPNFMDIGNAIMYVAPLPFLSFDSAVNSPLWRKMGKLSGVLDFQLSVENYEFKDGTPQQTLLQVPISSTAMLTGAAMEITPTNISRIMGQTPIANTLKSSNPTPTTISAGTTVSVLKVASTTGFSAGDYIQVGTGLSAQTGYIANIPDSTTLNLTEGLDGNIIPANGTAVAKVDRSRVNIGGVGQIKPVAIKIEKNIIGGAGKYGWVYYNCIADGSYKTAFNSDASQPLELPFNFKCLASPAVEFGAYGASYLDQS
jgi:hypothetical protein